MEIKTFTDRLLLINVIPTRIAILPAIDSNKPVSPRKAADRANTIAGVQFFFYRIAMDLLRNRITRADALRASKSCSAGCIIDGDALD